MTKTANKTCSTTIQEWILQTWRKYGGDILVQNKKLWIKPGNTPDPLQTALMILTRQYDWTDLEIIAPA